MCSPTRTECQGSPSKQWRRYVGLDFGGVHTAAVFLAEDPKTGKRYVYREYLAGGRTAAEHAKALLDGEGIIELRRWQQIRGGQWRSEFRAGGLPVREPDQPLVEVGIRQSIVEHQERFALCLR